MTRMELDRFVAEYGKEIKTNPVQDEMLKSVTYQQELEYLFRIMGVNNGKV